MSQGEPLNGTSILIWIVVIALILFRASRPQRISVARMWAQAIILMFLGAFVIYSYERLNPAPAWEVIVAIAIGVAAGVPVGILRGRHTQVSATDRHGVMQLGPSWATAGIYVGAFVLRALLRFVFPPASTIGGVVGDALMVFAIAIIGTTYYAVYRKYEALDRARPETAV
ncbi:MAG: hypothetical protein JO322_04350 [Candidatus Eremiobacteraeota bacterium]|nr:hypothetical protein [Candidatus Eremiobacteraeota bacterium]